MNLKIDVKSVADLKLGAVQLANLLEPQVQVLAPAGVAGAGARQEAAELEARVGVQEQRGVAEAVGLDGLVDRGFVLAVDQLLAWSRLAEVVALPPAFQAE